MKKNYIKRVALLLIVMLMAMSCVMPVMAYAVPAESIPAETIPSEMGNFMWFIHMVVNQSEEYIEALKTLGEAGADDVTIATAAIAAGLDLAPNITQMVGELKYAGAVWILSIGMAAGMVLWGLGKSGLLDLLAKILKGLVRNAEICMKTIWKCGCKIWGKYHGSATNPATATDHDSDN